MPHDDIGGSKIYSTLLAGICCALFLFCGEKAQAAKGDEMPMAKAAEVLASPSTALLSPDGGRLDVSEDIPVRTHKGESALEFVIPGDAMHPQIIVPGHTIARWSSTPILLEPSSNMAQRRAEVEKEKIQISARLATVEARLAVWKSTPETGGGQEMQQRQSMMEADMPALAEEKEHLEKKLHMVMRELAGIPESQTIGQLIRVDLADVVENGRKVIVNYSYDYPGCGWHAVYSFNARPDEGNGDMIDARLLAEVWQYTGIDWDKTKITLVTRGNGPREPEPLREWIVDSQAKTPKPEPRNAMGKRAAKAVADEAAPMLLSVAPPAAHVAGNTENVYASWTLSATGLPEGRSRLQIMSDAWKAPLQWLARPTRGDSRVWLLAKYNLPQNQAWPIGTAEYSVNNQNVGEGSFRPKGGEATLYFGADPRVNVRTIIDSKKHGESGFITASKTWSWAWTYTLSNEHDRAIKVRLERPEPQIVDEGVTVTYQDKPAAQKDDKEHMLFWIADVPAHGKTSIEHGVTISSPIKLPLLPDVP